MSVSRGKPVGADWLHSHYVLLGMDCVQIGGLLGKDPKTIWTWMRHYGVPTRPRGSNTDHLPKGRPPGFKLSEKHKDALRLARAKDGRLPFLKDGKHWLYHDGAVHPNWKGGCTPERQAFYASQEWREACKEVWHRADARCERCGKHHNTAEARGTFHVHHIVSFMVRETRAVVSNLALLCAPCHRFVHSPKNTRKDFL